MTRATIDFGIDLGTTNSSIAVVSGIDAKVITNKAGSSITPSAVWLTKRGDLIVGQEAKERTLLQDPANGDLEFKLRMGQGAEAAKNFARGGRRMLPEELSAEVLKSLRADVRTNLGKDIDAAVITVPAAFENPATAATMRAAQLAGITLSPLLLEPVAASLAYGFQTENDNVYWLVYDFGGGTFDAAVMRIRDGLIHVESHGGENFLGGKLLDWDIVTKRLIPAAAAQFNMPDLRRSNPRWQLALGSLKMKAELAKIEVCRTRASYSAFVENAGEDEDGKPIEFEFTLTPQDVQEITQPYLESSLILCRRALKEAGVPGSAMDRILMVGGSTLNPWLREAVQAELGSQLEFGVDPITVVARGAAIFASTREYRRSSPQPVPSDAWRIETEYKLTDNIPDPDIGGRVIAPDSRNLTGYTIELTDNRTHWRSGRISLAADGVFMTQAYAAQQGRSEFAIELCDPTGTRIRVVPNVIPYTFMGVLPPQSPPAAMTIGIGLFDGRVATYIRKGDKLPFRKPMDHYNSVPLRAGHAEDELPIPLLEGENSRAQRNHCIGRMVIRGSDLTRDLPMNSQIEITMQMDESQQIAVQAYVPILEQDFEVKFSSVTQLRSLDELSKEAAAQKERLNKARNDEGRSSNPHIRAVLTDIRNEQLVEHIDSLLDAAVRDRDALAQLDRRVCQLAAELDKIDDALEWPSLVEKAEKERGDTERVVDEHGKEEDKRVLLMLQDEQKKAIATRDADLLRRNIQDFIGLYIVVLDRLPVWHTRKFEWLCEQKNMKDAAQADQLIAQGNRAIKNNDIDGLKAANRQLSSLLPAQIQAPGKDANAGGTWV
jgi:molecular chaperone DnaK